MNIGAYVDPIYKEVVLNYILLQKPEMKFVILQSALLKDSSLYNFFDKKRGKVPTLFFTGTKGVIRTEYNKLLKPQK